MTETILSAVISAGSAIVVCILTSIFQYRRNKMQQEKTISLDDVVNSFLDVIFHLQ